MSDISIGSNSLFNAAAASYETTAKTEKLKNTLKGDTSKYTDEELMSACKSFESYLVEQVFKEMKKTVPKDESENNQYIDYFGDSLYQEYAKNICDSSNLGIAQMLYDSMKRNQ